ncbi:MAG TPA: NAD-dependent epimerase/dehydratase family protein [Chthoniobacterales bacterium]
MQGQVLITGGAGFIGSHLADELLEKGYRVRAYDSLIAQVHGDHCKRPRYLSEEVELVRGDLRDADGLIRALHGVDYVVHFAAAVGVGQSMYQISNYTDLNCQGTAALLETLAQSPVEKLVVASSMSIYGEGRYRDRHGRIVEPTERPRRQLESRRWDMLAADGSELTPMPTPETKHPSAPSVYALTKYYQERICLTVGPAYGIPTVALRFFNVFGPRQALSNPYTGVLAIFASRILNGQPPLINEDGRQQRDFIYVKDIALGCRLALESSQADNEVFNIGSGRPYAITSLAADLAKLLGHPELEPQITGKYRVGDIRHCYADMTKARTLLKFEPRYDLRSGLGEMLTWLDGQTAQDNVTEAFQELSRRGLTV